MVEIGNKSWKQWRDRNRSTGRETMKGQSERDWIDSKRVDIQSRYSHWSFVANLINMMGLKDRVDRYISTNCWTVDGCICIFHMHYHNLPTSSRHNRQSSRKCRWLRIIKREEFNWSLDIYLQQFPIFNSIMHALIPQSFNHTIKLPLVTDIFIILPSWVTNHTECEQYQAHLIPKTGKVRTWGSLFLLLLNLYAGHLARPS